MPPHLTPCATHQHSPVYVCVLISIFHQWRSCDRHILVMIIWTTVKRYCSVQITPINVRKVQLITSSHVACCCRRNFCSIMMTAVTKQWLSNVIYAPVISVNCWLWKTGLPKMWTGLLWNTGWIWDWVSYIHCFDLSWTIKLISFQRIT